MKHLFSVPLSERTRQELLLDLELSLTQQKRVIILTPNPEILVRTVRNKKFRKLFTQGSINIADGVGVKFASKVPIIKGRVLFEDLLVLMHKLNKNILLVGSTPEVITASLNKIANLYPTLSVKGFPGPKYDAYGIPCDLEHNDQENEIMEAMKTVQPTMVFVALGAPKQEFWIERMKDQFPHTSFMAIGGTLDTFSGLKALPPQWMSTIGLEWLYRLIQEPSRLLRIINAVILFPILILLDRVFHRY